MSKDENSCCDCPEFSDLSINSDLRVINLRRLAGHFSNKFTNKPYIYKILMKHIHQINTITARSKYFSFGA